MARAKKYLFVVLILTFIFGTLLFINVKPNIANAETLNENEEHFINVSDNNENIETYGLYLNIRIALNGIGDGYVTTKVTNAFTLFPATVRVIVELYSSDTYQDSYTNMTLVAKNFIEDLNMGKSIEASASTNGKQQYWKGRMYYKMDSNDWKEGFTETLLYDENGIYKK